MGRDTAGRVVVFSEPTMPALRMIERAAKIYHHLYGEWPDTVGLDIFTRYREGTAAQVFFETYYFRVRGPLPPELTSSCPELALLHIPYTNISLKIIPATFGGWRCDKMGLNPHPIDPRRGRDEVLCKHGEHVVSMHLLFTEHGYHAAIWEISKQEGGQQ